MKFIHLATGVTFIVTGLIGLGGGFRTAGIGIAAFSVAAFSVVGGAFFYAGYIFALVKAEQDCEREIESDEQA